MGRKPKLSWEQAAGIVDMQKRGLGTRKIAKITGLARALVRRVLDKWKPKSPRALPGGSPQLAFPVEQPRAPGALPAPGEAGAVWGTCAECGRKNVALNWLQTCDPCLQRAMSTYSRRPIGRGRCSGPHHNGERDDVLIFDRFNDASGLCGDCRAEHYRTVWAGVSQEQRPPDRDSRGLWWDDAAVGGRGAYRA